MKANKKSLKTSTVDNARRTNVLLESMDKKIDFLVEGYATHTDQIEKLDNKIENFRTETDYKFGIVLDELHLIKNQMVKRDEFVILEKRVIELEKRVR